MQYGSVNDAPGAPAGLESELQRLKEENSALQRKIGDLQASNDDGAVSPKDDSKRIKVLKDQVQDAHKVSHWWLV
jgi:hypothetical protein